MKIKRGDGILKVMIIAFPLIVLGNAIEYFAVTKDNLKKVTGRISEVIVKTYKCGAKGPSSKLGLTAICKKTMQSLNWHLLVLQAQ